MKTLTRLAQIMLALGIATVATNTWAQQKDAQPDDPYEESADAPTSTAPVSNSSPDAGDLSGLSLAEAERRTAEAKELNKQGIRLLDAGDAERALEYFFRSRDVQPNSKNVANAAIAMDQLGRYDEALELLEELLVQYAGALDDDDRRALSPMMASLRRRVGSLRISSNVGGEVTVDGRARGKLPLLGDIRVLSGEHRVRVIRNGYVTYETSLTVGVGETFEVDAQLAPLDGVGQLFVEDDTAPGAELFVDGASVGLLPWEGTLAPGEHLVWSRLKDRGTAPTRVTIVEGQASLLGLAAKPLGQPITMGVQPAATPIVLGGVEVGRGSWEGRLPVGTVPVSLSEPGYFTRQVEVESSPDAPQALTVTLDIDRDHARWPKPITGDVWADVFAGFSGGATLGGSAADACPERCDGGSAALGLIAGLRGGYRFPVGASIELSGGYWRLSSSFDRTELDPQENANVSYTLQSSVLVHGPFVGAAASYRDSIDSEDRFYLLGRLGAGILVAFSSDPIVGDAATNGPTRLAVVAENPDETLVSIAPYVMPELGVGTALGPFDATLSLGVGIFLTNGPQFDRGRFGADTTTGTSSDPGAVGNSRESGVVDDERAYSSFLVWTPQVSFGRTF